MEKENDPIQDLQKIFDKIHENIAAIKKTIEKYRVNP